MSEKAAEQSNEETAGGRRRAIKTLGGIALASLLPAPWVRAASTVKIGYVSPQTGPLAVFAEPDAYTLAQVKRALAGGLRIGGQNYAIEIIYKDSQSNSNRAAEVTADLILKDKVDIVVAASTPETTNPVADQCELNGVPCVTNDTPWQPHFFGRGGDPKKGFQWTYHFFWGLEDIIAVFTGIWDKLPTNRVVGALWPNDPDGNAWGDAKVGFPSVAAAKKFKFISESAAIDDLDEQINCVHRYGLSAEVEDLVDQRTGRPRQRAAAVDRQRCRDRNFLIVGALG